MLPWHRSSIHPWHCISNIITTKLPQRLTYRTGAFQRSNPILYGFRFPVPETEKSINNNQKVDNLSHRNLPIQKRYQSTSKVAKGSETSKRSAGKSAMAPAATDDAYGRAFNNNSKWRRSLAETEPELFERLGKGQAPQILWIGCADSRCPETTILGLQPGEIFCHRNIANILVPTDLCSLSVIQYAVQYLKVKHIIICGHTSCGGVAAALDNKKLGLIDTWLMPLRTLRRENLELLESLNEKDRSLKLVELNVQSGIKVLLENPDVLDAISDRDLQVHGLVYNVGTGELKELDVGQDAGVVKSRETAFKTQ